MNIEWWWAVVIVPVVLVVLRFLVWLFRHWSKVEAEQDKKLSDLAEQNQGEHTDIRKQMTDQHTGLRDKLDAQSEKITEVWKHLVKKE